MKKQHTQDKWIKTGPLITNKRLFTIHAGKLLIAKTCDHLDRFNNSLITPEQAEANAKLIASAPELLKILQEIMHTGLSYNKDETQRIIKKATN